MRKVLLMFLVALTAGWANQLRSQNSTEADIIRCYTTEADIALRIQQPELGSLDDFERWLAPLVEEYKSQQASNERINAVTTI
ncbi:MAG TPA: hypothetical protein ENJ82_15960, partial [Bacteroidetes bacterium]|nr:hypothetical protein [Bacteroidota bacterium]